MIADILTAVFVVAVVYVLVRPRSAAADAVAQFSTAVTAMIRSAVDI